MDLTNKSSTNRAKFSLINSTDIERLINEGKLDVNDIIYTKDTHENVMIGYDLSVNPVRSKIYRFLDVATAEASLNNLSDTYEGQLVAILADNAYTAYIVNKNVGGSFYVTRLSEDAKTLNYDTLGNRPIDNLDGTLDNPITVSNLATGVYKIRGQYKICPNDLTTYISGNDHIFLVDHNETGISLRKITATDIYNYTVKDDTITSKSEIPTTEWIEKQGYATQQYVDNRIAALNYMTREDVVQYVTSLIETDLEPLIDRRVEIKLKESLVDVESSEIDNLF